MVFRGTYTNINTPSVNVGIGLAITPTPVAPIAKLQVVGTATLPAAIFSSGNVGIGGSSTSFASGSLPTYLLQLRDGNMWVQRGTFRVSALNATDDAILVSTGKVRLTGGVYVGEVGLGGTSYMEYNTTLGTFEINNFFGSTYTSTYNFKIGSVLNGVQTGAPILGSASDLILRTNMLAGTVATNLRFFAGNSELARLNSTGYLGIGTIPVYGLDLNKDINAPDSWLANRARMGELVLGGAGKANNWLFHRPDDGRTSLYLVPFAPGNTDTQWGYNWANGYEFQNDGTLKVKAVVIGGSDFTLGKFDGKNQGTNTAQRAMVHGTNDDLLINFEGDFEGGVKIGGRGLAVKEVCVNATTAWCDYVFAPDYRLMPLNQLQSFIQKNKHLPEIPTSAEVEKDGISLSKMVTLQMKKIEEMTLYILELEARMKKMENSR